MKEKTAFYYKKWFKDLKFILMTSIMIAVTCQSKNEGSFRIVYKVIQR